MEPWLDLCVPLASGTLYFKGRIEAIASVRRHSSSLQLYNRNRRKTYYRPNTSFSGKLTEHELSMDNVDDQTWLRERKRGGKYMLYVHVPMDALYCGRIGIVDQLVRVGQTNEKGRTSNSTSSSIHLAHPDTYTDTFDESIYVVDVQSCPLSLEASLHF